MVATSAGGVPELVVSSDMGILVNRTPEAFESALVDALSRMNLDQLKPAKERVARQVTNGGAIMPPFKDKLSAAQIQAVAAYVSSVAGK